MLMSLGRKSGLLGRQLIRRYAGRSAVLVVTSRVSLELGPPTLGTAFTVSPQQTCLGLLS